MTRVHAFTDDDALGRFDTVGLVEQIQGRRVSIPEVVEAALARTAAVDPRLGAVAHLDADGARRRAADPHGGWFAGVPTFVKDNVDVAGMPTQQGGDAWQPRPRPADGDFARMYLATGLLPLGKSQLSEFGFSASAEHPRLGPVRSPWDPARTAGASSAGAAALVAAGAVPIAHANDGGGSIRIPASVNGLVGLKPTRGRLAQDATLRQMPVRLVSDGVLTRSVRDTAVFYREAERVFRNLRLPPVGDVSHPGRHRLRVAVVTESIGTSATPEIADLTWQTAALLEELGHAVEPVEMPLPESLREDFLLYWAALALMTVRGGRRTFGHTWDPERLDHLTHGLAEHAARHVHRLPAAIARLRLLPRRTRSFFDQYDVVLTPTLATGTPLLGHLDPTQDYETVLQRLLDWVAFTPPQNASGEPAVSLPLATTADGQPQGMMLGAGAGREATLLELALELEEARPWALIDA